VEWVHSNATQYRAGGLKGAGIGCECLFRSPVAVMNSPSPVPGLGMTEPSVDLFPVPMIVWDIGSHGRPHSVTVCGGAALIANQLSC